MSKEYIAYEGQAFTIEWYYSPMGESQALQYYQQLDLSDRIKVLKLFKFWKKQDKLPPGEKNKAVKIMNAYKHRIKEGTYYEKEN